MQMVLIRPRLWQAAGTVFLLAVPLCAQEGGGQPHFRQLYLSGKVVMQDGSPPPQPVKVELRCAGQTQPQAFTDNKGAFNFPVGGAQHRRIEDATRDRPTAPVGTERFDVSFVSLTGCELEAYLPGYTSSKIYLGRRSVFESPEVGTITLRPAGGGEGVFVSLNTLAAPEEARKCYEKAVKENTKERPNLDKVVRELEKAVALYPQFAAAWNLAGEVKVRSGDLQAAREAFRKSAGADPKFVLPLLTLALMDLKQNRMQEASEWTGRALRLAPNLPEANYYNAVAHSTLGNLEAAEASIRQVHTSQEAAKYPRTRFLLGNILAQRGDLPAAAQEFRRFLELEPAGAAADAVRKQLADWEAAGALKQP